MLSAASALRMRSHRRRAWMRAWRRGWGQGLAARRPRARRPTTTSPPHRHQPRRPRRRPRRRRHRAAFRPCSLGSSQPAAEWPRGPRTYGIPEGARAPPGRSGAHRPPRLRPRRPRERRRRRRWMRGEWSSRARRPPPPCRPSLRHRPATASGSHGCPRPAGATPTWSRDERAWPSLTPPPARRSRLAAKPPRPQRPPPPPR